MNANGSRRRALVGLAVAAVVGAIVLAVVVVTLDGGGPASAPAAARPAIQAQAVLAPRIALFGDTVTARVEVTLDRSRVDPDSIRIATDFSPWEPVGEPVLTRREGKSATFIQTTALIRCLRDVCVPQRQTAQLEFTAARVAYAGRGGGRPAGGSIDVRWPVLVVHSRLVSAESEQPGENASPWRADLVSLPAVSYRVPPGLVLALLLAGGTLFAIAGIALAYMAVPRRAPAPIPEPEEPPEPVLTPLEHALALLEGRAIGNGGADRRRALELVAEELAERDPKLANAARILAWSEEVPAVQETSGLATRVRTALEEESDEHPA